MRAIYTWLCVSLLVGFAACGDDKGVATPPDTAPDTVQPDASDAGEGIAWVADRPAGTRAPRSGRCDDADPMRCSLPWPSNVYTVVDGGTETGLRVALHPDEIPDDDSAAPLNRADGFSRITPLMTAFGAPMDPESVEGSAMLLVAEGPDTGQAVPLRHFVFEDPEYPQESLLVFYPTRPMAPATEHVVVILDGLRFADGDAVPADRTALIATGGLQPETDDDAAARAYHAPARLALEAAGIAPDRVLRLWDFTTRSRLDPLKDLHVLRDAHLSALDAGEVAVVVDSVTFHNDAEIVGIVMGRLTNLPSALDDNGQLKRDEAGSPVIVGTHDVPFRALIPAGEGDYRVVMFGHGTGGDVTDGSFDRLIGGHGAMKLGIEIDGWTTPTLPDTLSALLQPMIGTDKIAARLLESLAGAAALMASLDGQLGAILSADTIAGEANPAAGRRPRTEQIVWAGGSLGGVTGMVFAHLEPRIAGGVLNVPGAGFTHWLPHSFFYELLVFSFASRYDGPVDLNRAMAMTQGIWDPMDGAVWVDNDEVERVFLVQISVDDPVVPNVGSDLVATSLDALHIGAVLYPIIGLETATEAVEQSAVTQFHVTGSEAFQVHGFTTFNDTAAGRAAQQQFISFIESLWAGRSRIEIPVECQNNTPPDSCDFTGD